MSEFASKWIIEAPFVFQSFLEFGIADKVNPHFTDYYKKLEKRQWELLWSENLEFKKPYIKPNSIRNVKSCKQNIILFLARLFSLSWEDDYKHI